MPELLLLEPNRFETTIFVHAIWNVLIVNLLTLPEDLVELHGKYTPPLPCICYSTCMCALSVDDDAA